MYFAFTFWFILVPFYYILWLSSKTSRLSHLFCDTAHLLTYSMVQSPSWEATWFATSQEIPLISWNPKVHYRTHKRPPPVSILGQPNPAHIPTSHLLQIHPNIIHPSTPRSPQWSPSLRLSHQDPIHPPTPHPYLLISNVLPILEGTLSPPYFFQYNQQLWQSLHCICDGPHAYHWLEIVTMDRIYKISRMT